MSRTGKKLISIPNKIRISLDQNILTVDGPYGILSYKIPENLKVNVLNDNQNILKEFDKQVFSITNEDASYLQLSILSNDKKTRQCFGLSRTLINNMICGVNYKFSKKLEMVGVGYKAQISNQRLILNVGFSHPVEMDIPAEIEVKIEKNVNISLESIDKQKIGLFASQIRALRPPEPYKGKGIKYMGERIIRKAGKSAK